MASETIPRILGFCDQLSALQLAPNVIAQWANRALSLGLILFTLSLPHSIAATYISLSLCVVSWGVRDLSVRKFHFVRTPLDWPLACFAGLTIVSALASEAPAISLPKARALVIFGVLYLCLTNVEQRAAKFFLGLLLASSLAGVFFSLGEKLIGRGMIVTAIHHDSPLAATQLQIGDVIWMIDRHRVSSLTDVSHIFAQYDSVQRVEIEAIHAGDPLPVAFILTDELKARTNPLGVNVDGRSRRFRVSGFSRHFLTYVEQMQIFGLLIFGVFLAASPRRHVVLSILLFALFSLTLVLTASRAVIASYLIALVLTSLLVASRRIALITLMVAIGIGGLSASVLLSTRTSSAINFGDDSSSRRIGYMKAGLRLIPQHPVLGVGMDAHKRHWHEWGFPGDYITHTHSTPIQLAMERGLPALGCYVWLLLAMGGWLWRSYKQQQNPLAFGALAALLGFSISSLVNYNFGDSEVVMLLLFVAALSVSPSLSSKKRDEQPSQLPITHPGTTDVNAQ
ncbi:MAG: O-antigen ligase family protein [Blastocatellia bacterium]|nr:O-antigen ligase family protein [Blastocatellia bacterium]